jgi:hypothetical protein
MTVEEATSKFPQEVGIARYGEPEEIACSDSTQKSRDQRLRPLSVAFQVVRFW